VPPTRLVHFLLLLAAAAGFRLAYLDHPVQGDDYYYLAGAMHGQIDPAHPNHARYIFQGREVDMRGHPHPPLNVFVLTAALAAFGDIREPQFHAVYLLFSLLTVAGAFALALQYSPHPVWATLIAITTPAFLVAGNSFESDLPFAAFWTCGIAAFVHHRWRLAIPLLALAGLAAYQSVAAIPILWLWLWLERRDWRSPEWVAACTPAFAILAFQLYERVSSGALPVAMAAGYFKEYNLQTWAAKLLNAQALLGHSLFIIGPFLLVGAVILGLPRRWDRHDTFLAGWIGLFFAAACALFFAGSARYLLPIAAPMAILATRRLEGRGRILAIGVALQLALGLGLARVNYDQWRGYQQFVQGLEQEMRNRRVWINGEWGLRYYGEAMGALPLEQGQAVRPGDLVITAQLGYPIPITTGGGALAPLREAAIQPMFPLRLVGLSTRSAWSVVAPGRVQPFDWSDQPVDRVRAELVVAVEPKLSYLPMNAPEAPSQILNGVYQLEEDRYRWMADQASFFLKSPASPAEAKPLRVVLYIPDLAPARRVTVSLDGKPVANERYPAPGLYTITTEPVKPMAARALVTIQVDKMFQSPGDTRRLGVILREVGFEF
jgi:hypothetical protein